MGLGSGIRKKTYSGSRGQKATDSGSATLHAFLFTQRLPVLQFMYPGVVPGVWSADSHCAWCCSSSALSSCFLSTIFTPLCVDWLGIQGVCGPWTHVVHGAAHPSLCLVASYRLYSPPLRQCFGSGSIFRIRIWIQEGKITQKSRKKLRNFMFWSAGCSLLRAEGFFCNLDILYGGLGIGKL